MSLSIANSTKGCCVLGFLLLANHLQGAVPAAPSGVSASDGTFTDRIRVTWTPVPNADGTSSAAQFNHPDGVAVDRTGNVFVTDWENSTIRKITPAGVVTVVTDLSDINVDSAGNMYVTNPLENRILKGTPLVPNRYTLIRDVNIPYFEWLRAEPPPDADGKYAAGSVVTLTATAGSMGSIIYRFQSWSGDLTGNANPTTIVMDSDKAVTAVFEPAIVPPIMSLDEALNVPGWSFQAPIEHGRYAWSIGQWTVDTQTSHDGQASAVGNCANFANDQYTSKLLTTITGPGMLSYWTSGSGYLVLQVGNYVFDYYQQESPAAWTRREVPIPPGPVTLTWQPEAAAIQSSAIARLDELAWQPAPPGGPTLMFDPAVIVVPAGLEANLRVSVRGQDLTNFHWYHLRHNLTLPVGVFSLPPGTEPLHLLAEFNEDTIHFSRVTEADSGYYLVTAQLEGGATTCSDLCKLNVVNIPALQVQSTAPGQWQVVWSDAGQGMRLQRTRTLRSTDWQSIPGTEITNRFPVLFEDSPVFFRLAKP
jgi:hypothetical protein